MRPVFVETRNYARFMEGLSALDARGAEECRLIVVDGLPGLGKTTILMRWASLGNGIYLRAKCNWTSYWLLSELLAEMRIDPPHGYEKRFTACLAALGERAQAAAISGRAFTVVIDEADHVSGTRKLMETVRDLTDLSGVPCILVGMGSIRDHLVRYPQTASRISRYVRFEPAELEDVQAFLAAQCEVPVAPDLAGFVTQATRGFNREIREAIVAIERFGLRNPPASPEGLSLREMAGQRLINSRKGSDPIFIPGRAQ